MSEWLSARNFFHMGGSLAAVALLLLVGLLALLPASERSRARRPASLLLLYGVLFGLAQVFPPQKEHTEWIRVFAYAAILFALAETSLRLVTETPLGKRLVPPPPRIFVDVLRGLLFCLVGFATLSVAGLDPGSLLTTSALLTAVVGLALQDTLGNLFSGLALEIGRPFEIGDWVDLETESARSGRIVEIGWRATRLVTLDEVEIIVPNAVIARSTIRNFTRPSTLERRNVAFSAAYAIPPGRVREVVAAALRGVDQVLESPPPNVVVRDFGDSAVLYVLRYYTNDHRAAEVTDSLVRERVWHALDRARIPIPFPQREVRMLAGAPEPERDPEALAATLAAVDLFADLGPAQLRELAEGAEIRAYAEGEVLFSQGDRGDEAFVVQQGGVVVRVQGAEVARLGPGALFGESSLLTGEPRSATLLASSPLTVVVIGHAALRDLFQHHPELVERLTESLVARQRANLDASRPKTDVPAPARPPELLRRIQAFFER